MDLSKLVDWIKLSPKYLLPISLVSGFLLFASETLLEKFGFKAIVMDFRPWIGIVFLMATALIIVNLLYQAFGLMKSRYAKIRNQKNRLGRLQNLTPEEKDILMSYIIIDTRTQFFPINDGVVIGLESEQILYRSSNIGNPDSWSFNVQPWAWNMLKKHQAELFSDEEITNFRSLSTSASQRSRRRAGYPY